MKSSRLSQRKREKRTTPKKRRLPFGVVLVLALLVLGIIFALMPQKWDPQTRLSLAINSGGKIAVLLFDPETKNIITVLIPDSTEVSLSHSLGTWRLGSVWKLGENEKIGGSLLSESITKSFLFPTEFWADGRGLGFASTNPGKVLLSALGFYKTNLNLKDRLSLAAFSLSVKSPNRIKINLDETNMLESQKLADGVGGYKIVRSSPPLIASYFADSTISKENIPVSILDGTGSGYIGEEVGKIVEALGAKVVSTKGESTDTKRCSVSGPASATARKIALLFSCSFKSKNVNLVEVTIGEEFGQLF